jgi:DNA repair protein RecO (recombination protein O)
MPRPERAYRTTAIILKRRDFGEADRLLTILTPRYGKLDVLAKGARKLTSAKTGHVELFTRADLLIHQGREFGIVSQAEMSAPYLRLREDLERGAYAGYCVELLDRFTTDEEGEMSMWYALLDETLARLCTDEDVRLTVRYYEIQLLNLAGFRPELHECVIGHEPIQPEDQFFSYVEGGIVCPRHAERSTSLLPISLNGLKLLRHLQRSSYAQVSGLTITLTLHDDLERLMLGYLTYLLERRLQSVEFIRRLRLHARP